MQCAFVNVCLKVKLPIISRKKLLRGTWAEKTVSKVAPAEPKQWVSVTKP